MPTSHRPRRTVTRTSPSDHMQSQPAFPDVALLTLARVLGAIAAQAGTAPVVPAAASIERRAHAV